jgi:hypothetical protein
MPLCYQKYSAINKRTLHNSASRWLPKINSETSKKWRLENDDRKKTPYFGLKIIMVVRSRENNETHIEQDFVIFFWSTLYVINIE